MSGAIQRNQRGAGCLIDVARLSDRSELRSFARRKATAAVNRRGKATRSIKRGVRAKLPPVREKISFAAVALLFRRLVRAFSLGRQKSDAGPDPSRWVREIRTQCHFTNIFLPRARHRANYTVRRVEECGSFFEFQHSF